MANHLGRPAGRRSSRLGVSGATALILSAVLAGSVAGASWSSPAQLSSSGRTASLDLVTLSASTAITAYSESDGFGDSIGLYTRRSTDGGASWGAPMLIDGQGDFPALAGNGMNVDLVWNMPNGRVRYARSTDGGVSFGPSIALSPAGRSAWRPAVARGTDGTVVVVYEDALNGNVAARVSTDNGATFAPADVLTMDGAEYGLAAAIGAGVIYVAYYVNFERLKVRRSLNGGATWTTPTSVANNSSGLGLSMAAAGDNAYIAFTVPNDFPNFDQVVMRRTINRGGSWATAIDVGPDDWTTLDPDLGLAGGVLHVAFLRCGPDFDVCETDRVYHRRSTTGRSWNSLERVSPASMYWVTSASVGSHRAIVAYAGERDPGIDAFVQRRIP